MEKIKNTTINDENERRENKAEESLDEIKRMIEEYRSILEIESKQIGYEIGWESSCAGYNGGEIANLIIRIPRAFRPGS